MALLLSVILLVILPLRSFGQDGNPAPAEAQAESLNTDASSLRVPYMSPMILGRTYDYSTNEVGDDVFDEAARQAKEIIHHHRTNIQYKMVNDIKDVQDVLDVRGELSLKVKSGLLDISGSGSYLKEETDKTNFVEVLVKVQFETYTETLHGSQDPITNWKNLPVIGKHYVRSITYGGEMIASMRFYAKAGKSIQDIKAEIDGKVNAASLSVGVEGQFRKLAKSVSDTSDLVIKYYSTVMLDNVPQDQEGLEKAINNFPKLVQQQTDDDGNVRGVPLYTNVVSLSTLDPGNTKLNFVYDSLLASHLGDLEEMYDDLLITDRLVKGWLKNQYKLKPEDEQKVALFYQDLSNVINVFEGTIAELNTECDKTADDDAENSCGFSKLNTAFTAYGGSSKPSPRKYFREFNRVQEEVELSGNTLEDVGRKITNARSSLQSQMESSVNSQFGRLIGVRDPSKVEAEYSRQESLVNTLLEKGQNILPGYWFHAEYSPEEGADPLKPFESYGYIPFLYKKGAGQMFSEGCMKAPYKGIYLINYHLVKSFYENDPWNANALTANIVMTPGLSSSSEKQVVTRSSVEDDENSANCGNCDHALSQTLVLKVNINYYVCIQLINGKVPSSPENFFSALLLRKLA